MAMISVRVICRPSLGEVRLQPQASTSAVAGNRQYDGATRLGDAHSSAMRWAPARSLIRSFAPGMAS